LTGALHPKMTGSRQPGLGRGKTKQAQKCLKEGRPLPLVAVKSTFFAQPGSGNRKRRVLGGGINIREKLLITRGGEKRLPGAGVYRRTLLVSSRHKKPARG